MRVIVLAVLCLLVTPVGAETDAEKKLRNFCSDKWPKNYRMREHCLTTQRESVTKLLKQAGGSIDNLQGAEREIIKYCLAKWHEGPQKGYNWRMTKHCFDQQTKAKDRLDRD